jgi:ribosome-associated protein
MNTPDIPVNEFDFTFARSGGPGGQNVNKVSSKAILRWRIVDSPSLAEEFRARFVERFSNRITTDGDLVISSQKFRDQYQNIQDCIDKVRSMLYVVANPPKPRRATKPTAASKLRRVEGKREASQKKAGRRRPGLEE